jgi:serine O-acetyltransferase
MIMSIKDDYRVSRLTPLRLIGGFFCFSPFWLVVNYRISNWFYRNHFLILSDFFTNFGRFLFGAEIDSSATIGPGFRVIHPVGIVIGPNVEIGNNFTLYQNTTIGMKDSYSNRNGRRVPIIGDKVKVFCGVAILGPVNIGDDIAIGANYVVITDVPSHSIFAGSPAIFIKSMPLTNLP